MQNAVMFSTLAEQKLVLFVVKRGSVFNLLPEVTLQTEQVCGASVVASCHLWAAVSPSDLLSRWHMQIGARIVF